METFISANNTSNFRGRLSDSFSIIEPNTGSDCRSVVGAFVCAWQSHGSTDRRTFVCSISISITDPYFRSRQSDATSHSSTDCRTVVGSYGIAIAASYSRTGQSDA